VTEIKEEVEKAVDEEFKFKDAELAGKAVLKPVMGEA